MRYVASWGDSITRSCDLGPAREDLNRPAGRVFQSYVTSRNCLKDSVLSCDGPTGSNWLQSRTYAVFHDLIHLNSSLIWSIALQN